MLLTHIMYLNTIKQMKVLFKFKAFDSRTYILNTNALLNASNSDDTWLLIKKFYVTFVIRLFITIINFSKFKVNLL